MYNNQEQGSLTRISVKLIKTYNDFKLWAEVWE